MTGSKFYPAPILPAPRFEPLGCEANLRFFDLLNLSSLASGISLPVASTYSTSTCGTGGLAFWLLDVGGGNLTTPEFFLSLLRFINLRGSKNGDINLTPSPLSMLLFPPIVAV